MNTYTKLYTPSLVAALFCLSSSTVVADPPAIGEYAFDEVPRTISDGDACPEVELVDYEGTHVPFSKPVKLDRRFVPKMIAFEKVLQAEARRIFGRELTRLNHRGGYRCRPVTGKKSKWSEHALGNALDIASFSIADKKLAFGKHWRTGDDRSEFLHAIVRRAIDEKLFRIILGPGDPGHEKVLHVDFGTSWYVRVDLSAK